MWNNKNKIRFLKILTVAFTLFSVVAFSLVGYMNFILPEEFSLISGDELKLNGAIPIKAEHSGENSSEASVSKTI